MQTVYPCTVPHLDSFHQACPQVWLGCSTHQTTSSQNHHCISPQDTLHHSQAKSALTCSPALLPSWRTSHGGTLHLDTLSLFWNIWANPETKVFAVLKYLLKMSDENSLTWSAHIRLLFLLYNLPDPLHLLDSPPWPRERWKMHTRIAVTSHHERLLRSKASTNIKLKYLNVQTSGLSGRSHPMLTSVHTTQDVTRLRPHIKMLSGDYLSYVNLDHDRSIGPHCRMCQLISEHPAPPEDLTHILTSCRATTDTRSRIMPTLLNAISDHYPSNTIYT